MQRPVTLTYAIVVDNSADWQFVALVDLKKLTNILKPSASCVVRTATVQDLVNDLRVIRSSLSSQYICMQWAIRTLYSMDALSDQPIANMPL